MRRAEGQACILRLKESSFRERERNLANAHLITCGSVESETTRRLVALLVVVEDQEAAFPRSRNRPSSKWSSVSISGKEDNL